MAATHSTFMRRALVLAKKGKLTVSPNPMVGCVIVKNNKIIAEGWHKKAGEGHAEINALSNAKQSVKGASVYVSLEPCCHYGRTAPCVDALINAGIKTVVIAALDPNPLVAGKGVLKLEEAGIEVITGVCEKAANILNKHFFHYIQNKRPYVILKWAMSLDGKTVVNSKDIPSMSSKKAWQEVHLLRQSVDAILVGANTVIQDNPRLTARIKGREVSQPLRVILSTQGNLPLDAHLLNGSLPGKTLVATTAQADSSWVAAVKKQGNEVLMLSCNDQNKISLDALLDELGRRHIMTLLVEGGMTVHHSFLEAGLVNEIQAAISPVIIGTFNEKQRVLVTKVKELGGDYRFSAHIRSKNV